MNACITLLLLWPQGFAVPAVDVRALPEYKTWIVALQDGPDAKRAVAAHQLRVYGRHALPALGALQIALRSTDSPKVARDIATTIAALGPDAIEAVPDLVAAMERGTLNLEDALQVTDQLGVLPPQVLRHVLDTNHTTKDGAMLHEVLRMSAQQAPARVFGAIFDILPQCDSEATRRAVRVLSVTLERLLNAAFREGVSPHEIRWAWLTPLLLKKAVSILTPLWSQQGAPAIDAAEALMTLQPERIVELFPAYFRLHELEQRAPMNGHWRLQLFHAHRWLIHALADADLKVRRFADHFLTHFGDAKPAWSWASIREARRLMLAGLNHPSAQVREALLDNMEQYLVEDDAVRHAFVGHLRDPHPEVRFTAAYWLNERECPCQAAVPVLAELAASFDPDMRTKALRVLGEQGHSTQTILPLMMRLCKHPHAPTRERAAFVLARIDPSAHATYLPLLQTALESSEFDVTRKALLRFAHLGPTAKACLPACQALLNTEKNETMRVHIQFAIAMMEPTPARLDELVAVLMQGDMPMILRDVCPIWRRHRLTHDKLLANMRTLIETNQKDGKSALAASLATACLMLDSTCKEALRAFDTGIREADSTWLRRLLELDELAKPLLPAVLSAYQSGDLSDEVRLELLHTLNRLGPRAASLASGLAKLHHGPLTPYVQQTLRLITREERP